MSKLLTALALALGILFAVPAASLASRPGVTPSSACVSGWEFNQLTSGASRAAVEDLLDGPGRATYAGQRAYRSCAGSWRQAQVVVRYAEGRLTLFAGVRLNSGSLSVPSKER